MLLTRFFGDRVDNVTKCSDLSSNWSWIKFPWIEHERDFTSHHLCEAWNSWFNIFPVYRDFEWKTWWFHVKLLKMWIGHEQEFTSHNIKLKWHLIPLSSTGSTYQSVSNTIWLNIEQTWTSFIEDWMNLDMFICKWLNSNTQFLASDIKHSIVGPITSFTKLLNIQN